MHTITGLEHWHTDVALALMRDNEASSIAAVTATTVRYDDHRKMLDAIYDKMAGADPETKRYLHTLKRRVLKERANEERREATEERRYLTNLTTY